MADNNNDLVNFEGIELVINKASQAVFEGVDEATYELASILGKEVPKGVSFKDINIHKPKRVDVGIESYVSIDDKKKLKWLWGRWKGTPFYWIIAHNRWLVFRDWFRGNDSFRWKSDGAFHFRRVRHEKVPGNKFVEMAEEKARPRVLEIISRKLRKRL